MPATMTPSDRFVSLQTAARLADDRARAYRHELDRRYQSCDYAKAAERTRLKAYEARASKTSEQFFAFLDQISPRDWRSGVPYHWGLTSLTYADAVTRGHLAIVPPPAYGYTPQDCQRFAWPVREECVR